MIAGLPVTAFACASVRFSVWFAWGNYMYGSTAQLRFSFSFAYRDGFLVPPMNTGSKIIPVFIRLICRIQYLIL